MASVFRELLPAILQVNDIGAALHMGTPRLSYF